MKTDQPEADLTREAARKAARLAKARRRPTDVWSSLMRVVGLGWVLVLPLALGAVGGRLVGRWLGRPSIALVGLGLGLAAGAYGVYRQVKLALEDDDVDPPDERRDS
jgi:F0F1-type ATP synthase assembly protein I